MVIDSSVLLAIILGEPDAPLYAKFILHSIEARRAIYLPAPVLVEAGIVAEQQENGDALDELVEGMQPEVIALDRVIAELARAAFRTYGRGRHPAKLNFGDCMSYATARHLRLPLLFKGDDFSKTDIQPALSDR